MRRGRTTTSCSAIALSGLLTTALFAAVLAPEARLFPIRAAWTLPLDNVLIAPPAFAGTNGYFPIEGDRLAAYDVVNGTLLWVVSASTAWAPVPGDGLLYLATPDTLTALHDRDGSVAWHVPLEPLAVPPVWDAGWLVAATKTGRLLAFRATDGELIWQHEAGASIHAKPVFGGERVYLSLQDARVVALNVMDGGVDWERRLGGPVNDLLALDDRLYVGSNDNFFYCLRTKDGLIEWRWRTGGDVIGTAVADTDRVYFVSLDNVLRALDRFNGAQRWKRSLPIRPTRGITRAADALLVSGAAPRVPAFNIKDGTPAGDVTAAGELAAAPHVIPAAIGGLPMVIVVGREIAKGAVVSAMARSIDPVMAPLSTLPNPLPALSAPGNVPTR